MPHDHLQTLLRVRRLAVEEGRRSLATSLDAASTAAGAVREAELAIIRETERATSCGDGDHMVEAFAAWLPAARQRVAQALAWQDRRESEVALCRADLTACKQALESLEQLSARRQARSDESAAREEARRLDEAGSWPKPDLA